MNGVPAKANDLEKRLIAFAAITARGRIYNWVRGLLGCRNKFIRHRTTPNGQLTLQVSGSAEPPPLVLRILQLRNWKGT
jgi:hypothetical protein